ncbi:MAG TPA: hypothetical protein VEM96_08710 [Pyrinomonadaceae bacterium]|nr:hypothetical protein [Pyrinomonadaceae bacterium]
MRNKIRLASVLMLFALVVGLLVAAGTSAAGQEQPAVIKTSLQVTARTLNFYGKNRNLWSWVPYFRFSLTRDRGSGDQHYVEYTIPGAGPALKFDCELNQKGDGFECGGRSIPEDKGSTYTGPVNFAIKVRNELQGTDATVFTGRMKVAKACTNPACPVTAGEWVYYVDHDWNLPIGHIFYNMKEPDYPAFNVAFWVRGNTYNMEPHLFYQGKEIGVIFNDGIQMGKAICRAIVENEPTHTPHNMVGGAKWSRMDCEFPIVKGWDNKGENQKDIFKMAENPGEYEFKLLWNNKLARSIKFTVGLNGKLDNGIAAANKLGTGRVIVPVMIIGDQDGLWDKNAWKTDAFYGNPLSGFTPPQ